MSNGLNRWPQCFSDAYIALWPRQLKNSINLIVVKQSTKRFCYIIVMRQGLWSQHCRNIFVAYKLMMKFFSLTVVQQYYTDFDDRLKTLATWKWRWARFEILRNLECKFNSIIYSNLKKCKEWYGTHCHKKLLVLR